LLKRGKKTRFCQLSLNTFVLFLCVLPCLILAFRYLQPLLGLAPQIKKPSSSQEITECAHLVGQGK
jgi:hypothetical protein